MFVVGIPKDFTFTNTTGFSGTYYALFKKKLNWADARLYCNSLHDNSHLAVITSEQEQEAVTKFLKGW